MYDFRQGLGMHLLVIEDEPDVAEYISRALRRESYIVDSASTGQAGIDAARSAHFDLIVLDVRLPEKDGWAVCTELRASHITAPILILTASGSYEDRVRGLDLGADDYLVKPFDVNEFLARVRALLRRPPLLQEPVIRIDTLEIDTRARIVTRAGQPVRLTAKEYALLECLARDVDAVLTRDDISERVWNAPYDPFSNVIEEYIKRLRKKVDLEGQRPLIRARRGEGYVLTAKELA